MNLYTFGADVMVEDSMLLDAGGPATMVDHHTQDGTTQEHIPVVDFINCTLRSLVNGEEPWFGIYDGATDIFLQMAACDSAVYANKGFPTGRSMMTNVEGMTKKYFNLACIFKSDSNGVTEDRIKGSVTVYESREDYEAQNREEDPIIKTYGLVAEEGATSAIYDGTPLTDRAISGGLVYFQSNLTGGYFNSGFNGTTNLDATFISGILHGTPTPEGQEPVKEYANIYLFNGMGLIFELFPTA
jgi:hypothetical protein